MNTEWAIAELDKFIIITVIRNFSGSLGGVSVMTSRNLTAVQDSDVMRQAQLVEKIFERVIHGWRTGITNSKNNRWPREVAIRAREEIARAKEVRDDVDENTPELSAAELHEWAWSGVSSPWQSGHFREGVEGAIRNLNAETENKVGRRDISETDLFKQVFSTDEPKASKARLPRITDDGSDTYKSAQRGTLALEGVFAGIRYPHAHEDDQELAEQGGAGIRRGT